MSTFLFEFTNQLDENWKEVDLLIQEATSIQDSNINLYNALCRSITVLIVAHLEGFTKNLVKAIIHDINSECEFKNLPLSIQRTYCKKYLGIFDDRPDKNYERNMSSLLEKFCEVNSRISHEPFLSSSNKNPKPDIIKNIFRNFGVDNVFSNLHSSDLDQVFSESSRRTRIHISEQKEYILNSINVFPYSCNLARIKLEKCSGKTPSRTLWQEFLDEINKERNRIAHGNFFENSDSASILEEKKDKVFYLQLGLIELLAGFLSEKISIKIDGYDLY